MLSMTTKKNVRKAAKSFARIRPTRYLRRVRKTPAPDKTKDEEEPEKIGLYLSPKVARELRIAAATHGKRISAMAEQFIVEGLARLAGK